MNDLGVELKLKSADLPSLTLIKVGRKLMQPSMTMLVLSSLTSLLLASGCQTTPKELDSYSTDGGSPVYSNKGRKELSVSAKQTEKSRQPTESQSAATEAEGNWGAPVNGFQVGISLPRSWFKIGDRIPVQMFVRNIGDQELRYSLQVPDKNLRIELRRNEERITLKSAVSDHSFRERVLSTVKRRYLLHLQPGTQRQHMLELAEVYDLSEPGRYTMRAGRLVPGIDVETDRECFSEWVVFELRASVQK